MAERARNENDDLDRLISQFADLATEVILKEELLCKGLQINSSCSEVLAAPWASLHLEGGPYGLLPIIVHPPVREQSPYELTADAIDGRLVVTKRASGEVLANVRTYPLMPTYFRRHFEDSTSLSEIVWPDGRVMVAPPSNQGVFMKVSTEGEQRVDFRNPPAVGQAVFDAYAMEDWPSQEGPLRIELDAGRLSATYDGIAEEDFYQEYIGAIVDRIHSSYHVLLTMAPKPRDVEQRFFKTGVTVRCVPLGVWDSMCFSELYPQLANDMSRDGRINHALELVDIYGAGAVLVDLDIGAEFGIDRFADPLDAVASARAAFKFLSTHGCIPRLFHWAGTSSPGSEPNVDYHLEIDRAWYETWATSGAQEPHTYILGVGRNRFPYSAAWDVGRGGPPEFAREWNAELLGAPGFRIPSAVD